MAPTLSLCLMTPGPPERVRALLECCRGVVDEVVLVVDDSGDLDTLDACADLADRRFLVASSSIVSTLGWMLHQCRGDWILRLDDDEIPSAALLEALPGLIADRFPTNIAFHRRWLYPGGGSHIVTRPWRPDFQVRLVRNVPGIWTFPGLGHGALDVQGERRFRAEALYHADCILRPVQARRAKRARFAALQPDLNADGVPANEVYVPEDHDVETAEVPAADAAFIERVLGGCPAPSRLTALDPAPPRAVAYTEIERLISSRGVTAQAYAGHVALEDPPTTLAAGCGHHLEVVARNDGSEWWSPRDRPPRIRLGCQWLDPHSGRPAAPEDRALFTETVRPGQSTRVWALLVAPERPGRYVLEIDLVHEEVRWFGFPARAHVIVERR